MQITVKEAIKFIREKHGLEGWTDKEIHLAIHKSIRECSFTFTTNENGKLDGIFIGKWEKPNEVIHATYFAGKYKTFIRYLKKVFPNVSKITAIRFGKRKEYNL